MKKQLHLLLCLLLLPVINLQAQNISADFTTETAQGCSPLKVSFQSLQEADSGLSYYWDLGNGTTSTLQKPTTVYTESGSYDVMLVVSKGNESDTVRKENYIQVYEKPEPVFSSASGQIGCAPFSVDFIDQTGQNAAEIVYWHWDFGDGSISSLQNPTHSFNYQNSYSISLFVIDKNQCNNTVLYENYISAYKPIADFYADATVACSGELQTQFINNSQADGSSSYVWDFGDGGSSEDKNPQHLYSQQGSYSVKMIAYDRHQCSDTITRNNYILITKVTASFTASKDTICPDEPVVFSNQSTLANSFLWQFGDGNSSTQKEPTHRYSEAGDYEIMLIASNSQACSDTSYSYINVERVEAGYETSSYFSCQTPIDVQYYNRSKNAVSYQWKFGNGFTSNGHEPVNTYNDVGFFSLHLEATSKHGCRDSYVADTCMRIVKPLALFTPNNWVEANDLKSCVPLAVQFQNKSKYNTRFDEIARWDWDFGDGNISTQVNPAHTFETVGNFLVQLSITTAQGCKNTYSAVAETGVEQTANFTSNAPDVLCASEPVSFLDMSENQELIDTWYWYFGDNKNSILQNPTHFFVDTGYMDVRLEVYYNGCGAFTEKEKLIYVKAPYAQITFNSNCENPLKISFQSNTIDAQKVYWDFGDGSTSEGTNFNPEHEYAKSGDYLVHLRAVNEATGCSIESNLNLAVREIKADFIRSDSLGCPGLRVSFDGNSSQDEFAFWYNNLNKRYLWDFGDGSKQIFTNQPVAHTFKQAGSYSVKLIVKDFRECVDSISKQIKVYKPEAQFVADQFVGCMPMSVSFKDQTVSDTLLTMWKWNFGDGSTSDLKNPQHTYRAHSMYPVSLEVSDVLGCRDTLYKSNYIEALKPFPDFAASDRTICVGDSIQFICLAKDVITDYFWEFGDGANSSLKSPKHAYADTGYYAVTLALIDIQGCDSTRTVNRFIHVQQPAQPDFSVDVSFANCFPLIVHFSDKTKGNYVNQWHWNFNADSASSFIQNPIYTYIKPGKHSVRLTTTTSYGCVSSISKENLIEIEGPYAEIETENNICKAVETTFIASNQLNVKDITWVFGDGNTAFGDTVRHVYNQVGNVYPVLLLTTDDRHTCDKFFSDTVYIQEVVAKIAPESQNLAGCAPFDANLQDSSQGATSWLWNFDNGDTASTQNINYQYQQAGQYNVSLIVSGAGSCTDTVSTSLTVFPIPKISVTNDTLICRNDQIQLQAGGAVSYQWSPALYLDDSNSSAPMAQPDESIRYTVSGTDSNNCVNYAGTEIVVQQMPEIHLRDTAIIIGERVFLNAYSPDIATYNWFPTYGLNCADCPEVIANPLESTTYELSVTDTSQCFVVTEHVNIDIIKAYTVDVPTAFSPNGDGVNDVIFVRGWGIKELIDFQIFNRYNELVFRTNDITEAWDGSYKNNSQNIESYTYIVKVKTYADEVLTKTGTIKLLR